MPLNDIVLAAGCLCSSYIGGSFNFFSTARLLSQKLQGQHDSLLTALVSADMIVMALYFAFMDLAASSRFVKKAFVNNDLLNKFVPPEDMDDIVPNNVPQENEINVTKLEDSNTLKAPMNPGTTTLVHTKGPTEKTLPIAAILLTGILSFSIVEVSSWFETFSNVPGVSCILIAVLGSIISQNFIKLRRAKTSTSKRWRISFNNCLSNIGTVSSSMATVTFHLFFAAVGASANLREALFKGPSAFLFTLVVIGIHIFVTILGSFLINKLMVRSFTFQSPRSRIFDFLPLSFEEIMVGSNAAIGGPTTAASLSARMNLKGLFSNDLRYYELYSHRIRKALIFSGLICGILGYAIATNIGVRLGIFLLHREATILLQ